MTKHVFYYPGSLKQQQYEFSNHSCLSENKEWWILTIALQYSLSGCALLLCFFGNTSKSNSNVISSKTVLLLSQIEVTIPLVHFHFLLCNTDPSKWHSCINVSISLLDCFLRVGTGCRSCLCHCQRNQQKWPFLNALWFEKNCRDCQRDEQTQKCPEVWWLK